MEEFLASLQSDGRAKAVRTLELLRTMTFVPSKFWKKLRGTENLWELRVEYAENIHRILACTLKGNRVVLLHGFQKKTEKTPQQDLEITEQRKKQYHQKHGLL